MNLVSDEIIKIEIMKLEKRTGNDFIYNYIKVEEDFLVVVLYENL